MKDLTTSRLATLFVAFVLLLAACGSSEPDTAAAEAETADHSADGEASDSEAAESADADTTTEQAQLPDDVEVDERTADEIIQDELDLMMIRLGIQDLDGVTDCVTDRLNDEGFEVTGDGAPDLVAVIGCAPEAVNSLFEIDPAVAPEVTRTCALTVIGNWMGAIPLEEAEALLQAPEPPESVRAELTGLCGITGDTLDAIAG